MNRRRRGFLWPGLVALLVVGSIALALQVTPFSPSTLIAALGRVFTAQMDRLTAPGAPPDTTSGPFPGQGDDVAPSLGTFTIFVESTFQPLLVGYPGYDSATGALTSPTLFDPTTIIGRSNPHLHGSAPDTGGTPVGTAGVIVADSNFAVMPPGFQGPPGTREVHTHIADFNIAALGGLVMVRAGASAPGRPNSFGEVESLSGASGDPNLDFPAQSFFDVFVEVDLPPLGGFPGGILFNNEPLLVINNNLLEFPPHVVYIHGQTAAVPVYFLNDDPGNAWLAGDLFGWLSLAGHGMNYSNTPQDEQEFLNIMRFQPSMPLACQTFHPADHNGDGGVDLDDIILMANRWPAHTNIQTVQGTAAGFGAGCLVNAGPPLVLQAGNDVFHSPPWQSMLMLDLPAGFFAPGSDPFVGAVQLQGMPFAPPSSQPFQPQGPFPHVSETAQHLLVDARQASAQGDTVVRRLQDVSLFDPGTPAATQAIPIEIVTLDLVSVQPIIVTFNGGQNPQPWSVQMQVQPSTPQTPGAMTITRTHDQGGVFTSELPVTSHLTFRNQVGPEVIGPIARTETFYTGFGVNSPLGPGYDTGAPAPWFVP